MALPLLFSFLAPQLLAGTGMSALAASALGAGVGGAIQTGDLEQGLLTGLGAFAGGSLLGPVLGGAGGAGAEGGLFGGGGAGAEAALQPGQIATGTGANASTALAPGNPGIAGLSGAELLPPPAAPGGMLGNMFGDAKAFAMSPTGMGVGLGAMAGPALAGMFGSRGGGEEEVEENQNAKTEMSPIPRTPMIPGSDYQPGVSGEFDYGISTPQSARDIIDYNRSIGRFANGGMISRFANPDMPGLGPVRLARGGIVALAEGGEMPQQGGRPSPQPNEREIVSAAVAAIKGNSPQPEAALGMFLAAYGEEALRDLVSKVRSGAVDETAERFRSGENGEVRGVGDGSGTDDKVPARMVDGSGDVLLSDGEFVMRKDASDALERQFGDGFLDEVNDAGAGAATAAKRRVAA